MLTNFLIFLSKYIFFFKKSQNLDFSNKWGKIKNFQKNYSVFWNHSTEKYKIVLNKFKILQSLNSYKINVNRVGWTIASFFHRNPEVNILLGSLIFWSEHLTWASSKPLQKFFTSYKFFFFIWICARFVKKTYAVNFCCNVLIEASR